MQEPLEGSQQAVKAESFATPEKVHTTAKDSARMALYSSHVNHWPVKVDTFLMPHEELKYGVRVEELPKYYKETFFSKDSLVSDDVHAGRYGVAGDPVPYSLRTDDILTPMLLFFVLMLTMCVKKSAKFFAFQIRNFFRKVRHNSSMERESAYEVRNLVFMEIHTVFILTLVFFFYAKEYISGTYITNSEYILMAIFFVEMLSVAALTQCLQFSVNKVFFDERQQELWLTNKMMLTACIGILLTPMLMFMAYFGLSVKDTLVYTVGVIIFVKILLLYKCFQIFFVKKNAVLQNFLYFCTLEIVPLIIMWGILVFTANFLKVNY